MVFSSECALLSKLLIYWEYCPRPCRRSRSHRRREEVNYRPLHLRLSSRLWLCLTTSDYVYVYEVASHVKNCHFGEYYYYYYYYYWQCHWHGHGHCKIGNANSNGNGNGNAMGLAMSFTMSMIMSMIDWSDSHYTVCDCVLWVWLWL